MDRYIVIRNAFAPKPTSPKAMLGIAKPDTVKPVTKDHSD